MSIVNTVPGGEPMPTTVYLEHPVTETSHSGWEIVTTYEHGELPNMYCRGDGRFDIDGPGGFTYVDIDSTGKLSYSQGSFYWRYQTTSELWSVSGNKAYHLCGMHNVTHRTTHHGEEDEYYCTAEYDRVKTPEYITHTDRNVDHTRVIQVHAAYCSGDQYEAAPLVE